MSTIQELRKARGWSQARLARDLGVNQTTVYKWEQFAHAPSAGQLKALAGVFGVSMDAIDFERPARDDAGGGEGKDRP